jgi:hypothetical protein
MKNQLLSLRTILRSLGLAVMVGALCPMVMLAQTAPPASAISLGAPTTATLGQTVTLQAVLVDDQGTPIAKAPVYFVVPMSFLNTDSDVVVAQGLTDSNGLVSTTWQVRSSGTLAISAQFRGDEQHGASTASAQLVVTGDQQLYIDDQGVLVPFLSTAPIPALAGFWPRLTPWPVVLALVIVWSLYGRVAFMLFSMVRKSAAVKEERR